MCVLFLLKKFTFFSVFERDPIAQNRESESLEQELMVVVMWMLGTVLGPSETVIVSACNTELPLQPHLIAVLGMRPKVKGMPKNNS